MSVIRYEIVGHDYSTDPHPEGGFVLFDDYESHMEDAAWEYKQLQKRYDALVKKIGEIYQGA